MTTRIASPLSLHLHGAWWLLVAGWFCATLPAAVWLDLFHSLRAAAVFSHQAELASEVSALLHPAAAATTPAALQAAPHPAKPAPPPAAAESGVRKFELPLLRLHRLTLPEPPPPVFPPGPELAPPQPVADVPHPPPRAARSV